MTRNVSPRDITKAHPRWGSIRCRLIAPLLAARFLSVCPGPGVKGTAPFVANLAATEGLDVELINAVASGLLVVLALYFVVAALVKVVLDRRGGALPVPIA